MRPSGGTEQFVARMADRLAIHEYMTHPDDREARGGTGNRGPATDGVPTEDALVGKAHAPQDVRTRGELHAPGWHLEHVRSTGFGRVRPASRGNAQAPGSLCSNRPSGSRRTARGRERHHAADRTGSEAGCSNTSPSRSQHRRLHDRIESPHGATMSARQRAMAHRAARSGPELNTGRCHLECLLRWRSFHVHK